MMQPKDSFMKDKKPTIIGKHTVGTNTHELSKYVYYTDLEGWPVEYHLGICPTCGSTRYKYWAMFNQETGLAHRWDIIRKGKAVDEDEQKRLEPADPDKLDWSLSVEN